MAVQAAYIAETIAGMKRTLSKYQDSSDSDEPYLQPSNRGNKLKRKAHHLERGHSNHVHGPKPYRKTIEHGTYKRDILRRNPKRYDEDGDELNDSDSDDDANLRAAQENPYAEIFLENLLLPLVSASNLPEHPSLSIAYTSPILTNMAQNACKMVQRERKTLAHAKRIMTKLRGDDTWLPCGLFCSELDERIFDTKKLYNGATEPGLSSTINGFVRRAELDSGTRIESWSDSRKSFTSGTELGSSSTEVKDIRKESVTKSRSVGDSGEPNGDATEGNLVADGLHQPIAESAHGEGDNKMEDVRPEGRTLGPELADTMSQSKVVNVAGVKTSVVDNTQLAAAMEQDREDLPNAPEKTGDARNHEQGRGTPTAEEADGPVLITGNSSNSHLPTPDPDEPGIGDGEGNGMQEGSQTAPRRMRTRAQAQAASEPTASTRNESPESWVQPEIHPLFKIPEAAIPDKDWGLPKAEADETRRLLTLYVQKQEEVCRGAETLYDGLLQADRQRNIVLKWCKAEGHVGEMSDGEDWYDKEEWGLEEDLEKGHNEEDGDTNAMQGKKTRGRRA